MVSVTELSMEEVERLLVEWGRWVWSGTGIGYASTATGAAGMPDISDDDALRIDRALAQLRRVDGLMGQLMIDHYRHGLAYRFLAAQHGVGIAKVSTLISAGKAYVLGALTNFSQAA